MVEEEISERKKAEKKEFAAAKPESDGPAEKEKLAEELRLLIKVLKQSDNPDFGKFANAFEKLGSDAEALLRNILYAYYLVTCENKDEDVQALRTRAAEVLSKKKQDEVPALVERFRAIVVKMAEADRMEPEADVLDEAWGIHMRLGWKAAAAERELQRLKALGAEKGVDELRERAQLWGTRCEKFKKHIEDYRNAEGKQRNEALRALQEAMSSAYGALVLDELLSGRMTGELKEKALATLRELKGALDAGDFDNIVKMKEKLKLLLEHCEGPTQP
ncbi:MAG: hypothetical protein QXH27_02555 [Candidatus Micrarchaeia archaeon]